ncbi:hypothetical protein [Yersinia frederiksenii]|uniref:hypothetical protein n=1 Tax=Yersinia frederiksenii TaxID=29484 RepID=UPI0005E1DCF2|nr:hypothetical protein [Yersinia frederiksenii]CQI92245.1 Uncharacterised protein [Yersinia frederiksenii]
MKLYEILKTEIGSNAEIGRRFPAKGKPRTGQAVGKWRSQGVPEDNGDNIDQGSNVTDCWNTED